MTGKLDERVAYLRRTAEQAMRDFDGHGVPHMHAVPTTVLAVLDELRQVSDLRAKHRRSRMRLVDPDPEREQERRFVEALADALAAPVGVATRVYPALPPGTVYLVDGTLLFSCDADRDRFMRQLALARRP